MIVKWIMLVLFAVFMAVLPACSTNQPLHQESMLDQNWGRSFESQKYNQILHPDAGKNLTPVTGLDGQAALKALEKYRAGDQETNGGSTELGIQTTTK